MESLKTQTLFSVPGMAKSTVAQAGLPGVFVMSLFIQQSTLSGPHPDVGSKDTIFGSSHPWLLGRHSEYHEPKLALAYKFTAQNLLSLRPAMAGFKEGSPLAAHRAAELHKRERHSTSGSAEHAMDECLLQIKLGCLECSSPVPKGT